MPEVIFFSRENPALVVALLILATCFQALADIGTATQTLNVVLIPAGKVSIPSGFSLTTTGTTFNAYRGTLRVSYRFRTAQGGGGSISLRAGSDFLPSGGPSIASGALVYSCGPAGLGVPCAGPQTVSTTLSTAVVAIQESACTGGGGSCSAVDPATVELQFTLDNSPEYETGSYSSSLVFTVSTL